MKHKGKNALNDAYSQVPCGKCRKLRGYRVSLLYLLRCQRRCLCDQVAVYSGIYHNRISDVSDISKTQYKHHLYAAVTYTIRNSRLAVFPLSENSLKCHQSACLFKNSGK